MDQPVDQAADPDAGEEGHQHDGEAEDRRSHHQRERPGPEDLVPQGAEPGDADAEQREPEREVGSLVVHGGRRGSGRRRRGRGLEGRSRHSPVEDDCGHTHRRADAGRQQQGRGDAHGLEQEEAGDGGAHHGAQGVEGVEERQAPAEASLALHDEAHQHGQGGAHERGRHDPGRPPRRWSGAPSRRAGSPRRPARGAGRSADRGASTRRRRRADAATASSRSPYRRSGRADQSRAVADQRAPEGLAAHVDREHRRHGEVGRAEHEAERAGPGHLVDQGGRAGRQEEGVDQQANHAANSLSRLMREGSGYRSSSEGSKPAARR